MSNSSPNFAEIIRTTNANGFNVHDNLKDKTVPELKEICDVDRLPFGLCLLNVTGDLNIGTIMRSALMLGGEKIIMLGRKKYDQRSTVGAQNYINVEQFDALDYSTLKINPSIFVDAMNSNNYCPIFVEQGGLTLGKFPWGPIINQINWFNRKPCLVMGNEGLGIDKEILDTQELFRDSITVSISQRGVLRSYNVSSAASMVMWEMCRSMEWL